MYDQWSCRGSGAVVVGRPSLLKTHGGRNFPMNLKTNVIFNINIQKVVLEIIH